MAESETPMDRIQTVSTDSATSDSGAAADPSVFIQHGFKNEANFSQPIQGQITQVGRNNIVNIYTETQTFRFKISSKHRDVEAVVAINMVLSDEDLDSAKTLVLGPESNQGKITAGEEIIVRIETEKQATRPRNGYNIGCGIRSITSSILTSLFERVEMIVNYFRHGSIIIGLQPKTDRAVFTLINAMEGGFIEELVRGILENEPDWNIDDDSDEPIKMKIDINIPKGMFPKDFPCRKFASRKELLEELTVSLDVKEQGDKQKARAMLTTKTSRSEMSLKELVKELVYISEDEQTTRMTTIKTIRRMAEEVKKIHTASNVAMAVSSAVGIASLVLAPFTLGLSLAATAGAAGVGVLASVYDSTQQMIRNNKAQEQFVKYDGVLGHLLGSLTLVMERSDKDDIKKALADVARGSSLVRDNKTVFVLLEDIHGFELQKTFMVPFKGKMVPLKDLKVMDYVSMFLKRKENVSDLTKNLERLARDLEAYEVVTSPRIRSTKV